MRANVLFGRTCRVGCTLIGIATAMLAVTSAGETSGERLFVLVSPEDDPGPGTIVAFDIGTDGIPSQAESYPSGGDGRGRKGPQDVVIDAGRRFLFASNNISNTISAFAIRPDDGTLEPVPGSPFPVSDPPSWPSPFFLAVTPDASFLYATTDGGVVAFDVGDDGALDPIQNVPIPARGLAVSPDGRQLYAISWRGYVVHAYRITHRGTLREIAGSPFEYDDASRPWQLVVSRDGRRLWLLDLDTGIAAFEVSGRGALRVTGQTAVGAYAEALEPAANDRYLYAGLPFEPEIRGYLANGDAPETLADSPFTADYSALDLLAAPDGSRLYQVNRYPRNLASFAIDAEGGLSPIGPATPLDAEEDTTPSGAAYLSGGGVEVAIDVKPGSEPSPVNVRSRGVIPVAILGNDGFEVFDVVQASVRFGPGEAIPAHPLPHRAHDIDGDGDADLVLHFSIQASGIACGDTTVALSGATFDGRHFRGSDTITVLGCDRPPQDRSD